MTETSWRPVAARAASLLLRYPDPDTLEVLPTLLRALDALPPAVAARLRPVAEHRAGTDPGRLADEYVQLFDFRRRCCLYLTYYTAGDTRRRGEALVLFTAGYQAAGVEVVGELPDFLPAVLDLAAVHDDGWRLLRENRIGLDLLAGALDGTVYGHAVEAVRVMLPPPQPGDIAAAVRLAQTGPPVEQVGLEPFGLVDTTGGRR
ncbi:nitrate reductase molybdenum cofactor assembly chaperone [Dactylosporangium aurantiacum]|uniref:Nitrate reductase molybdenum cofactor assembly chaperone n=1 Tax=Dactylosporangium aurantiacum TaxID=35754 RepID=A0A9Q9MIF4_9ACTN|nr:nitrate reductase molybdenum cofactor assembly chaperone [Dactylosporangium aurantiacum]MDG6110118.1 nitrate reductase molybdenum cofactor assembly chaperone [Dactylosporangium aurantiacum]UWZ57864.1 nitrate reductase molybdenum cofactor assembly chaperone [Dactylosporangium aurantiacum]